VVGVARLRNRYSTHIQGSTDRAPGQLSPRANRRTESGNSRTIIDHTTAVAEQRYPKAEAEIPRPFMPPQDWCQIQRDEGLKHIQRAHHGASSAEASCGGRTEGMRRNHSDDQAYTPDTPVNHSTLRQVVC
jgi:hypothetical protein